MIKFFRKIRHNLLLENNIGKYFTYAIGEIILVVIGILIALSINNWNEKRLQQQTLKNIYAIIIQDLTNDIADIDAILEEKHADEPIFNKILDGSMTKEDYDNCDFCQYLIIGNPTLTIEKRGYSLLNNFNSYDINSDSLTIEIIQFYAQQLTQITVDDELRAEDIANNVNDWKNKYSWYADYITERQADGFITYSLNNQDYKNRVANYYLLNYTIYIPKLEEFNEKAKFIIARLEERLD